MQITNSHTRLTEIRYLCKIIFIEKFYSLEEISAEGPEFLLSGEVSSSQQLISCLVFRLDFTSTFPPSPSGFVMTVLWLRCFKHFKPSGALALFFSTRCYQVMLFQILTKRVVEPLSKLRLRLRVWQNREEVG